jgi:serine palmitoyltransferase
MGDLRNILSSIADDDVRLRRDTLQQRRFIVVEGLYRNTGAVCPLTELIALKAEFFYRLVVDETLSFGVLGPHGKGVTDLFGAAVTDVDILTVAMDTVLASVGGVCLGNREVVDHQRLAGAGYCFSASAPPFLSAVAISTLNELRDDPTAVQKLHQVISSATAALDGIKGLKRICYSPDIPTPVVHFVLETQLDFVEEEVLLARLAGALLQKGIAVSATKLPRDAIKRLAAAGHRPTLRLSLNSTLSSSDVNKAVSALQAGIDEVIFGKKSDWLFSYSP